MAGVSAWAEVCRRGFAPGDELCCMLSTLPVCLKLGPLPVYYVRTAPGAQGLNGATVTAYLLHVHTDGVGSATLPHTSRMT